MFRNNTVNFLLISGKILFFATKDALFTRLGWPFQLC